MGNHGDNDSSVRRSACEFFRQVTRKQATQWRDRSWQQVPAETVLQGAGRQTLRTYMARRQAIVAEWVATRPIFDVCAQETGCEGGGLLWVLF